MSFGEKVREIRTRLGWTQSALAKRLGVETMQISKWERGQTRSARPENLQKLADLAGVEVSYFIESDVATSPQVPPQSPDEAFREAARVYRETEGRGLRWTTIEASIRRLLDQIARGKEPGSGRGRDPRSRP